MPTDPNRLEVERVRNLVQGFGWSIVKEEYGTDEIIVVMKKTAIVTGTPSLGSS